MSPDRFRFMVFNRRRMGLLVRYAQLWQNIQNSFSFNFKLFGQFVDSHPLCVSSPGYPSSNHIVLTITSSSIPNSRFFLFFTMLMWLSFWGLAMLVWHIRPRLCLFLWNSSRLDLRLTLSMSVNFGYISFGSIFDSSSSLCFVSLTGLHLFLKSSRFSFSSRCLRSLDLRLGLHTTFSHTHFRFGARCPLGRFCLSTLTLLNGSSRFSFQAGKIIIDRYTDFFHRLRPNARQFFQLLRRHVCQRFHGSNSRFIQLGNKLLSQIGNAVQRRGGLGGHRNHLLLHFLALLFFTLDVDLPAQELGREPNILPLLANGQRELAVVHHNFEMFLPRIKNGDAAHLGRLQCFFCKGDRIFVILDDVNLLAAQLADDGLHTHPFHSDTSAHGVHIFVFRSNRNFGALTGFARDGFDLDRAVVNFRHLGLEQVLHQLRRGA